VTVDKQGVPRGFWVERALTLPIAAGVLYCLYHLYRYSYLPQPYFYEPSGTFMDFFAPATFAQQGGAYNAFQTIYPPLSFVVLKLLSWGPCYAFNASEEARACDTFGVSSLAVFYLINVVLIAIAYRKLDRSSAAPRIFALSLGLPMTYALERGNVLLFCFTCLILAYGPILKSARWRWFFAGLTVNFKVYLIGTVFAQLLRHRWRWFEGAIIATILIYLVTYALYGEGTPRELYDNITAYAGGYKASTLLDLWYPSSLRPMVMVLQGDAQFPTIVALGSTVIQWGLVFLVGFNLVVNASIILAAVATWWRSSVVPMHRLILLSMGIAIINSEVGGYTQMFVVFLVFMERWRGFGRIFAIVTCYVLCIALDIPIEQVPPVVRDSYFANANVIAEFYVGIGAFLRPMLVHAIMLSLSWVTIRDVYRDARRDGWKPYVPWQPRSAKVVVMTEKQA
jgi:hypothetical protein